MYGKVVGIWECGKEMEGNKGNIKYFFWEIFNNVEVGFGYVGKLVIVYVMLY